MLSVFLVLLFFSCLGENNNIYFEDLTGNLLKIEKVSLDKYQAFSKNSAISYRINSSLYQSDFYLIEKNFKKESYISVKYHSDLPFKLMFRYQNDNYETFTLDKTEKPIEAIIYLKEDVYLEGIVFFADKNVKLNLLSLREGDENLLFEKDAYIARHFIDSYIFKNNKIKADFGNKKNDLGISISNKFLNLNESAKEKLSISLEAADYEKSYAFKSRQGLVDLSIYLPCVAEDNSRTIEYDLKKSIDVKKITFEFLNKDEIPTIDFAQLLDLPYNENNSRYNLYRWDINDNFFVFDFIDYQMQARFLKRLAFFVEKPGYRGTLPRNSVIKNLHGWNAHDYRAYDLAEFFTKAKLENFILNPEEYDLLDILLENNVLVKSDGIYKALKGGFISITRESSPYLRKLFIDHEGYHALFFDDEDLRFYCENVWDNNVSEERKRVWKAFFDYKSYDYDDNKYLLVNEFFAYSLQANAKHLEVYVPNNIQNAISRQYPKEKELYANLINKNIKGFVSDAKLLEEYVEKRYSLIGGNLRYLD